MITNKELSVVELSPTKKDFYQIWNELLEVASNLSERWDPTSTNESDPGIVLLKVLTAVADKLNYTIDANTLEAFMPSAAQEESMKKLCDMLGYDMKYLRSATTDVKISYNEANHDALDTMVQIDKFTNLKDIDGNINYITLEDIFLNADNPSKTVPCMEGELVECETADDNIVSILHLDDNKRYYLPETQIAENGIFITNINDGTESELWERVNNLNTQNIKTKCFKFGFDSREFLPYIQFPADISSIIEDGLKIRYVRTKGAGGNISTKTLCRMETPLSWSAATNTSTAATDGKDYYNIDNYTIYNISAATTGRNAETITEAYESYKKTVGTFDTLVTCRDYMNAIYQMTTADSNMNNLVSNVIVSDIRDDINKAMTMCTFTERGIEYKTMAKPVDVMSAIELLEATLKTINPNDSASTNSYYGEKIAGVIYKVVRETNDTNILYYTKCIFDGNQYNFIKVNTTPITHFDLVVYPFTPIYGLNSKSEYDNSFKYSDLNLLEIKQNLEENKTLSHNFITPDDSDIACIKNYYKLNAKITTTRKVSSIEQLDILEKVYSKIYENFNSRKLDFGEEIPYESILEVMETADPRIKYVKLEDPEIITKFCTVSGAEYAVTSNKDISEDQNKLNPGDGYYNQLVLNNIVAGRVPAFNYDTSFTSNYAEAPYPSDEYDLEYTGIKSIETSVEINSNVKDLKLGANETIQFRLPNLTTLKTYPAYVNYFLKLNKAESAYKAYIPATMHTISEFLTHNFARNYGTEGSEVSLSGVASIIYCLKTETKPDRKNTAWSFPPSLCTELTGDAITVDKITKLIDTNSTTGIYLWNKNDSLSIKKIKSIKEEENSEDKTLTDIKLTVEDNSIITYDKTKHSVCYLRFENTKEDFAAWRSWLLNLTDIRASDYPPTTPPTTVSTKLTNIYKINVTDFTRIPGAYIDDDHNFFKAIGVWNAISQNPFEYYFVPKLWTSTVDPEGNETGHTANGLGQNGEFTGIEKDTEYQLKPGEYLLINYTNSSSSDGTETQTKVNECYSEGKIIRPNFKLVDSETYHITHKYPKESGFNFTNFGYTPEGMFTLGTNEQIEIRDIKQVELDELSTNVYWERMDEKEDNHGRIYFKFKENPVDMEGNPLTDAEVEEMTEGIDFKYLSYVLKEGEYFYYTDKNKLDIAYYGSGTKITRTLNTPEIFKYKTDNSISTEEISNLGLNAAIPWRPYDFSKSGSVEKKLVFTEYQYINLTEGDMLNEVTVNKTTITNDWIPTSSAKYTLSGSAGSANLPTIDFSETLKWEVRSKLELNIGPTVPQTLRTLVDKNTNNKLVEDKISLTVKNVTNSIELVAVSTSENEDDDTTDNFIPYTPLTLKSNKYIKLSTNKVDTSTVDDLRIRLSNTDAIRTINNSVLNLNNFGDGQFTKLSFTEVDVEDLAKAYTTLNAFVPENKYGLIMMYNYKAAENTSGIYLKFRNTDTSSTTTPTIFNHYNGNTESWWTTSESEEVNPSGVGQVTSGNKYFLRKGINIIKIPESCTIEIYPSYVGTGDTAKAADDILIIGNLDIINSTNGDLGINPKLKYKKYGSTSAEKQLLKDLRTIDPTYNFYYNNISLMSSIIDMNDTDTEDNLEYVSNWYDPNNINNKFVISEIDTDHLIDHVTIAKTSRGSF